MYRVLTLLIHAGLADVVAAKIVANLLSWLMYMLISLSTAAFKFSENVWEMIVIEAVRRSYADVQIWLGDSVVRTVGIVGGWGVVVTESLWKRC